MTMKKLLFAISLAAPVPAIAADVAATNDRLIGAVQALFGAGAAQVLRDAADAVTLSPLAMFMDADWVVKSVLLLLAMASGLAWAIWAGKWLQIANALRKVRAEFAALLAADLQVADLQVADLQAAHLPQGTPVHLMRRAAQDERAVSYGLPAAGIKERVSNELARIEYGAGRAAGQGAAIIGSIGATAPFVGLFGTVWGIMNSFVAIADSGTTNLSVVAPGIAEALLATAIGLVAAIPAVLFYNHLVRLIAQYRALLADCAAWVERCLSRDLDRALGAEFAANPVPFDPAHLRRAAE